MFKKILLFFSFLLFAAYFACSASAQEDYQPDIGIVASDEMSLLCAQMRGMYVYADRMPAGCSFRSIAELLEAIGDERIEWGDPDYFRNRFSPLWEYTGIGAVVEVRHGWPRVKKIFSNGAANTAGLREGDFIIEIGGTPATHIGADLVKARLGGDDGAIIRLTVLRKGKTMPLEVIVRKSAINPDFEKNPLETRTFSSSSTGYIRLDTAWFTYLPGLFEDELKKFREKKVTRLIIDARNQSLFNHEIMLEVLGLFLKKDTLAGYVRTSAGKTPLTISHSRQGADGMKIVALINSSTAGAVELFATALRDNAGAKLIGSTTAGYGVETTGLAVNDRIAVVFPTGEYLTSKGMSFDETGVAPDIPAKERENEAAGDALLERALAYFAKSK